MSKYTSLVIALLVLSAPSFSFERAHALDPVKGVADVSARDRRISDAASALRTELVTQRRDFHMHPELSNREERTSRVVAERLRALEIGRASCRERV